MLYSFLLARLCYDLFGLSERANMVRGGRMQSRPGTFGPQISSSGSGSIGRNNCGLVLLTSYRGFSLDKIFSTASVDCKLD